MIYKFFINSEIARVAVEIPEEKMIYKLFINSQITRVAVEDQKKR